MECQYPRCREDSVATCHLCDDRTCRVHVESHSGLVRWDAGEETEYVAPKKGKRK